MNPDHFAVLAGAGDGVRLGRPEGKAMVPLLGRPLFWHSLRTLTSVGGLRAVAVVLRGDQVAGAKKAIDGFLPRPPGPPGFNVLVVEGSSSRQASVRNGLEALARVYGPDVDLPVIVHDVARPLASRELFESVVRAAGAGQAVGPAVDVADSLCALDPETGPRPVPRDGLVWIQTPQGWVFRRLLAAHRDLWAKKPPYPDDLSLAADSGAEIRLVGGEEWNVKVTTPGDLRMVQSMLAAGLSPRAGIGVDVHPLVPGGGVRVAGVTIPCDLMLTGHSDADPAAHAAIDALLGAAGMGDIGGMFPPGDLKWRGADSMDLLRLAWERVAARGFRLVNLDVSVLAELPRLSPHYAQMRVAMAKALGCDPELVSVKATTCEKLGFIGRGEGIAALATAAIAPSGDVS